MAISLEADATLPQGYLKVNGTTAATVTSTGITGASLTNGSVTAAKLSGGQTGSAPAYACRAWVNFDGTRDSTGAASTANTNRFIRSSGNVASVLRNGTGDYTVTFTTPMSDANYSVALTQQFSESTGDSGVTARIMSGASGYQTANSIRVGSAYSNAQYDSVRFCVQVFGN